MKTDSKKYEGEVPLVTEATVKCEAGLQIEVGASTTRRYNFMVVGAAGSGKTTFCEGLLRRYFPSFALNSTALESGPTTEIKERGRCVKIQGNTKIIVTVVDTPGFGDSLNNNDRFVPVENYVSEQNQRYEDAEGFRRPNHQENDSRIHCCFYFMMPHRVTPLDIDFMRRLQSKVSIVPLIAKADTMLHTNELPNHLRRFHKIATGDNPIRIFDFGETNIDTSWLENDDEEWSIHSVGSAPSETPFTRIGMALVDEGDEEGVRVGGGVPQAVQRDGARALVRPQLPNVFAVISGKRPYLWGTTSDMDPAYSDTPRLHQVLFLDKNLLALGRLHDRANEIHESWRKQELALCAAQEAREEKRKQDARVAILALLLLCWAIFVAVAGGK